MTAANFPAALGFVWGPGRDDPADGYHVTPGDAGLGTRAGVTEATWAAAAVDRGIVSGSLQDASQAQLAAVLHAEYWGGACDALPPGVDLLLFNGRMMSGHYPALFQQCLGFLGVDVDGLIGPASLAAASSCEPVTLIDALTGVHHAYLRGLEAWPLFGRGWTTRLRAARALAIDFHLHPRSTTA